MIIYLFLFSFIAKNVISLKNLFIPVTIVSEDDCYIITYNLGNRVFRSKISQSLPKIIVYYSEEIESNNNSKTNSRKKNIVEYNNTLSFDNSLPFYVNYISIADSSYFITPNIGFGLPLKYENDSFSPIIQMKKRGLINKLSYTLFPKGDNSNYGHLYFGDIPEKLILSMKNKALISINSNSNKWSFQLKQIKFGKTIYKNNDTSVFDVGEKIIIVSKDYYNYLEKAIFHQYINQQICKKNNLFNIASFYSCRCHIIKSLPPFEFMIDNKILFIDSQYLFEIRDEDKSDCFFKMNVNDNNNNQWSFGTVFLDLFISQYNYDTHTVVLYSNVVKIESLNNSNIRIIILNISIIFIGLISLIIKKII